MSLINLDREINLSIGDNDDYDLNKLQTMERSQAEELLQLSQAPNAMINEV